MAINVSCQDHRNEKTLKIVDSGATETQLAEIPSMPTPVKSAAAREPDMMSLLPDIKASMVVKDDLKSVVNEAVHDAVEPIRKDLTEMKTNISQHDEDIESL